MGNSSLLTSPIESPALADAARADWSALTAQEHERSLRGDIKERNDDSFAFMRALGALQRLLFYYPRSGREVAQNLLTASLSESDYDNQADLVVALDPFQWDGLDEEVLNLYREAVNDHPSNRSGRLFKFDLAFACAKRLRGHGHDQELVSFFRSQNNQIDEYGRTQDLKLFLSALDGSISGVGLEK
jgi:hypothetical protein